MGFFSHQAFQAKQPMALGRKKKTSGEPGDILLFGLCLVADVCSFCLIFSDFDLRRRLERSGCALEV